MMMEMTMVDKLVFRIGEFDAMDIVDNDVLKFSRGISETKSFIYDAMVAIGADIKTCLEKKDGSYIIMAVTNCGLKYAFNIRKGDESDAIQSNA